MEATREGTKHTRLERVVNILGITAIHAGGVTAFFLGARTIDIVLCVAFYWIRMFAITGAYHRYFSHRGYKTSRWFQFVLALIGTTATQKGPLWWAAIHRRHHRESDTPRDVHSPIQRGFWYSHIGWVLGDEHEGFEPSEVKDLWKYPELRWLDRWHIVPVFAFIGLTVLFGGLRGIAWWYAASTMFLMHATFTINSLSHVWGKRRFATSDDSRNNPFLAFITMGEGWHNNHHRYMQTANQGFYWWQFDFSYYILKVMSWFGLVWDLRTPPQRILDEGRKPNPAPFVKEEAGAAPAKVEAKKPIVELPDLSPSPMPADAE